MIWYSWPMVEHVNEPKMSAGQILMKGIVMGLCCKTQVQFSRLLYEDILEYLSRHSSGNSGVS
jgi:hypothetical protein